MKKLLFILIVCLSFGCSNSFKKDDILGKWVEKIETGQDVIPKVLPKDCGSEDDFDFYVTFSVDSITTSLCKTVRTTFWTLDKEGIISFPDEGRRVTDWKIIECSDSSFVVERAGMSCVDPEDIEIVKFIKLK